MEMAVTNLFTKLDIRCHRGTGKKDKLSAPMCQIDGGMLLKAVLSNRSGGHGNPADLARNEILHFLQVDL